MTEWTAFLEAQQLVKLPFHTDVWMLLVGGCCEDVCLREHIYF